MLTQNIFFFIFTIRLSWRYRNTHEDNYRNLDVYNVDKIHFLSCITNIGVILETGLSLYKPKIVPIFAIITTIYILEWEYFSLFEYLFSLFIKKSHICFRLSTSCHYSYAMKKWIHSQNFMLASDELSKISIFNYWGSILYV